MDVGQLCLQAENHNGYKPLLDSVGHDDEQLFKAERETLTTTHPELGAALLESWQMDNFMADALRYHHAVGDDLKHAHHLVKIVNLSSLISGQKESGGQAVLSDQALARANDLFGFNEDLLRELHARIESDVRRIAGGLGVASGQEEDPALTRAANWALGDTLGQLTQLQALRQTLSRHADVASADDTGQDMIGRALYLSFGFEKHLIFFLHEERGTLEASLDGSMKAAASELADFVLSGTGDDNLVQRCFTSQQAQTIDEAGGGKSGLLDQQLLRYCRQPGLICLPFTGRNRRGVLVAGANQEALAQHEHNAGPWRALLQEMTALFDPDPRPAESGQKGQEKDSTRISEAVHEVSNPLSVINNYLEILRLKLGDRKDTDKEFAILKEEIDRIGKILLRLNKPGEISEAESVDVNAVVDGLARIFRESMCVTRGIKANVELDNTLQPVLLNKSELKQVLTNLVENAVETMPGGGTLTLQSEGRVMVNGRAHLALKIEDTGVGIPEQVMSRLFTPGVTAKDGAHAGLGLSVVKKLMDAMNAQIMCSSNDEGTQFRSLSVGRAPWIMSAERYVRGHMMTSKSLMLLMI